MRTVVEVTVISKKESRGYYGGSNSNQWELVFYDPKSIFHRMSGGTGMNLMTVNQDVAKGIQVGDRVMVTLEKVVPDGQAEVDMEQKTI